jgi:hypothetical protein
MSTALERRGYGPAWLKDTYLLGVDLTLDDGSPYPERIFTEALKAAERELADELGLTFSPQTYTERHDKEPDQAPAWWPIRTQQRPLHSVERLELIYGQSQTRAELPRQWLTITEPLAGQAHIIPTTEGSASYFTNSGLPVILGLGGLSSQLYVPAYFNIRYKAGFALERGTLTLETGETQASATFSAPLQGRYEVSLDSPAPAYVSERSPEGLTITLEEPASEPLTISYTADTLPPDIVRAIALKSSLLALNVAGDLIAGAGIAQSSIGVDGLSQSIATTASATNAGYGARVLQFEREYKALLSTLKANYRALNFMAL